MYKNGGDEKTKRKEKYNNSLCLDECKQNWIREMKEKHSYFVYQEKDKTGGDEKRKRK